MRFMLFFGLVLPGVAGAACSTGTVFQQVDCLRDAVTNQKQKIDTLMYIMRSAETEFLALEQRVAVLEATSSFERFERDDMGCRDEHRSTHRRTVNVQGSYRDNGEIA